MKRFSYVVIAVVLVGLFVGGCVEDAAVENGAEGHIAKAQANRNARMEWWRDGRFGMFIHWGLYAVPAGEWNGVQRGGYSEWLPKMVQVDDWDRLVDEFNPVEFDADAWVKIAKDAGMKYIVITTKHHEGFAMWNSAVSDHDIMATPFKRDVMAELAAACRRGGIKLGWYHSVLDWRHVDYLPRREIDKRSSEGADYDRYIDYMKAQIRELLTNYGDVAVLWFDGGWDHGPQEHRATEICDMAYALQPGIIINDRIGLPMDYDTPEQRIPKSASGGRDWETCMTITSSWGYNKGARNWKSAKLLVRNLVDIASKGGNYLLNVGPTGAGVIPAESVSRLREIGKWLTVNGDSIYGTDGSIFPTEPKWGRCTVKQMDDGKVRVYLHVFDWPMDGLLKLNELGTLPTKMSLLGDVSAVCSAKEQGGGVVIKVKAGDAANDFDTVVMLEFSGEPVVYYPPVIQGDAGIFIDGMDVRLEVAGVGLDVRYTLDGSEPAAGSAKYAAAIRLADTTVVKARSFYGERAVADVVERKFVKVAPDAAAEVGETAKGLWYRYYEGVWNKVPAFDELTAVAEGVIGSADIAVRRRQQKCAIVFDGYVDVPVDGVYRFALASDDGSNLLIDGEVVIENDGFHAREEKMGVVALARGKHAIRIEWFNGAGGAELDVRWGPVSEEPKPMKGADVWYAIPSEAQL